MADEPAFTCERTGFKFKVFANRIDVEERQLFGAKKETILLRNVTDVSVNAIGGKLKIMTTDGKAREWVIGTKADEARNAIAQSL